MKFICTTLILYTSLFLNCSQAEESSATATQEAHHVGSTCYPLGTKDHPVTASEYCAFLNSNDKALGIFGNCANIFAESSFMNVTADGQIGSHAKVLENDCITRYSQRHFRYSVITGREDYIIDGLSWGHCGDWLANFSDPQGFYPFPITEFNTWRQNPTSQEICNYLNQKIEGNEEGAAFIKNAYPKALFLFDSLDTIALISQAPQIVLQEKFNDEHQRCIFTFSQDEDQPSSVIAVPVLGMEYYRPLRIDASL